jgi:hypothetical protein
MIPRWGILQMLVEGKPLHQTAWGCIGLRSAEVRLAAEKTDIPRILGLCAEAERAVSRVLDRVSGGEAALDTARASATQRLSGECQWDLSSGIEVRN